jgi:hypothetical protein
MLIPSLTVRRISSRGWARGRASTRSRTALAEDRRSRQGHLTFQVLSVRWVVRRQPCSTRTGLQVDVPRRNGRGRRNPCGTGRGLGGWSSGSTSGAGSEPTRAIKVPWGMVTEELPLAHLGERQRSQWSRCQPDPSAIIARVSLRTRGSAGSGWSPYGAVRCWPRSETGSNATRSEVIHNPAAAPEIGENVRRDNDTQNHRGRHDLSRLVPICRSGPC